MNNTTLLAVIILSVLPASAQKVTSPDCPAKTDAAIALSQDYAAHVDGLLRDVYANLQGISERAEAGGVTSEQEEELKLAAARDMTSRLDTLSAVYDMQFKKNGAVDDRKQAAASNDCAADKEPSRHNGNATVSVEELKSEGASRFKAASHDSY